GNRAPCFIATRTAATASVAPPPAGPPRPGPSPHTSPPPGPGRIRGPPAPSGSPRPAPTWRRRTQCRTRRTGSSPCGRRARAGTARSPRAARPAPRRSSRWPRSTRSAPAAPASVAVSRWPWAGRAHTAPPARASTHPSGLAKRDVVRDADIGRERRHHRAVFLERELDRPTRLRLVHAIPSNGEPEVQRGVAARLRLAARPGDSNLEFVQRHALLLEDHHYVRRRARGGGDEQQLDGRRGRSAIAIHANRRSARRAACELELVLPPHDDLAHVSRHRQFPRRVVRPT